MSNPLASSILANIAKVLIVIGLVFMIWKIIKKQSKKRPYENSSSKAKKILYNLHKVGFILATILGFIHALLVDTDSTYLISGWILGGSMIIMSILGIYLGFQSKWQPFVEEQDQQYKIIRIIKWILTPIMFLALIWHFFPTIFF